MKLKVIIAGSRKGIPSNFVLTAIEHLPPWIQIGEVVCGMAAGVDTCGLLWARRHDPPLPVKEFPADWDRYGKAAGHVRNGQMADYADALILVWDGRSRGSANMKQQMIERGKPILEVVFRCGVWPTSI